MNFKEHYTLITEAVKNSHLEFLIHIRLSEHAFDKIKARPGYTSMVKDEKTKIFFAASTALNNYPFDGKRGAFSDDRMKIQADTEEFKREDIPYIDIYTTGVEITADVIKCLHKALYSYRPALLGTIKFKNLYKEKITPDTLETFGDLIDEL
jgi:hypothetical protein